MFYTLRLLPFSMRIKVGGAILAPIISRAPYYRDRIEKNLKRIFPDLTAAEYEKIRLTVEPSLKSLTTILTPSSNTCFRPKDQG